MTDPLIRFANAISALVGRMLTPAAALVRFLPDRLCARWFGSDVLVGSTTNYTWTANQFGHFTVGLALYAAIRQVLAWITWGSLEADAAGSVLLGILAVILAVLLYAIKETADFKLAQVPGRQFAIEDKELRLDGFADSFFVGFGAVFLMTATWSWLPWLLALAVFGGISALLALFYLPRADRFDFSNLPLYYRLPLYQGEVLAMADDVLDKDRATQIVTAVSRNESDLPVLLVLGAAGTGRTSLVVGIGTRLGIAKVKLRFTAAVKLNDDFMEELRKQDGTQTLAYNYDVWAIRDVTHVIIDDVPAADAEGYLNGLTPEVQAFLRDRILVIVVAGGAENTQDARATAARWTAALHATIKRDATVQAVLATRELDPRRRNTATMQD